MTIKQNQDGSASTEAYSLAEYSKDVIELSQRGYRLNCDLNEGVPQSFGSFMSVKMYPTVSGVQAGSVPSLEISAQKEVIESVKVEGTVNDYFKEDVKPLPLGVTVETTPASEVVEPVEQPVKVDGRRKKN